MANPTPTTPAAVTHPRFPMNTEPTKPMNTEPTDHTFKAANDLTLEELNFLKDTTAGTISDILNRFSEQTGLRVESVDLDIAVIYGGSQRYSASLDVRL
jgi:hypothetical protein